jgi:hypothetical protein
MKPIIAGLALVVGTVIAAPLAAEQAQAPSEPAHKIFVLTGCLTGGPADTAAFKLTGAVAVGQAPPKPSAASPDAKDVYELVPVSGISEQGLDRKTLQTHVGKKVEVALRPVEVQPAQASSSSSTTATTAKPQEPAPARYTVSKLQALPGACP